MYHEHPLKILKYSAKNIWLLVFPLVRGIWAMKLDVNKLYMWLRGAWFDILVIILIILFGFAKWYFSRITFSESAVIHKKGIIIKSLKIIPYENLSALTREHSYYLRPFRAVRVFTDTCGGIMKTSDMRFLLSYKVCAEFINKIPQSEHESDIVYRYKPKFILIFFFSALFSSSFSGVVYIGAFFFEGGQIAQDIIRTSLDRFTAEASKFLIMNIPYAVLTVIVIIFGAWLISFITNMIRYSGFFIRRYKHIIRIESGRITPRRFLISQDKINYYYLRQNLLMKIFRVMSVNISCSGYETKKNKNYPVFLPIESGRKIKSDLENAAGIRYNHKRQYKPKLSGIWNYIWFAVLIAAVIFPVFRILPRIIPELDEAASFFLIMAEIPAIWFFIVRIAALLTSGVTIDGELIYVRYSKRFDFYTIIGEKSKLVKLDVKQNLFQRYVSHKCTVSFYFHNEISQRHYVKGLKLEQAKEISEKCLR